MDLNLLKEIVLVVLFIIVLFSVFFPLKFADCFLKSGVDLFHSQRYSTAVSIINCICSGIFLATCLLHLFPDVREAITEALSHLDPNQKFPFAEFSISMGFFLLLTIEQIISDIRERLSSRRMSEVEPILPSITQVRSERREVNDGEEEGDAFNHHQNSSIRALAFIVALSIHSLFEGFSIGVQDSNDGVLQITFGILLHKIVIGVSLGLNLLQSPLENKSLYAFIFSATTPIGIALGLLLTTSLKTMNGALIVGVLQGLACGSFLYVIFFEILPLEFKTGHLHLPKLLSFIFGFSIICVAIFLFPE